MIQKAYRQFFSNRVVSRTWLALVPVLLITACNTNDLSDLNDLANDSVDYSAGLIFLNTQFTAEQVIAAAPVVTDDAAAAEFLFDTASNTLTGQVVIDRKNTPAVSSVQVRRGFAGRNGAVVVDLVVDANNGYRWNLLDGFSVNDGDARLLLQGGLYVQVHTETNIAGALRAQLLTGNQELLINPLTADQVVNNDVASDAHATSYLTVDFISGDIKGSVWHGGVGVPAQQAALRAGDAGLTGEAIVEYERDAGDPGHWQLPEQTRLSPDRLQQLVSAQLYTELSYSDLADGGLRGQIYPEQYLVRVINLSGAQLMPSVDTGAGGKGCLTLDGSDGSVQIIVRVTDIQPSSVILFRLNGSHDSTHGRVLFELTKQQDYWRMPEGSYLATNDFSDLANGRLMIVVTSQDFPNGEIGGQL